MRNPLLCTAAVLVSCWACSGGDSGTNNGGGGGSTAASVVVSPSTVTLNAVGATQVVHASVRNQSGGVVGGAAVAWASNSASATVASLGGDSAVVTAAANGTAQITASSGSASGSATAQVAQAASTLQKAAGDAQTGPAGTALATQLRVRVLDRLGAPVAGATVAFAVTLGGGSVNPATAVSGADGFAATTWTLGTSSAAPQEASASSAGVGGTLLFTATGVAGPAAAATINSGNNQTGGTGSPVALPPSVRVTDAFGNAVVGAVVTFAVASGGGSITGATQTTGANGVATVGSWTLGSGAGPNSLSATVGGLSLPAITFNATAVTSVPGNASAASNANQAAMAAAPVPVRPAVLVRDPGGNPIAGLTVTFSVTDGGGSVTGAVATTNASGVATVGSWTLGTVPAPNTLTARVTGFGITNNPVVFTAAGCTGGGGAGYGITLCFTTPMSASQRGVFQTAAARWAGVITADLETIDAESPGFGCGGATPTVSMDIDDLLIFAAVEDIDGPSGVLGSAGWCWRRDPGLPFMGLMRFDAADVASLEASNRLGAVITHEMGHVLGIGSLWTSLGLLQNAVTNGGPQLDTYFTGAGAVAAFNSIGGNTYTGGQKVPVENTGGGGTWNAHWRETVLANELMTGYLDPVSNPLSVVTVRSLADMGYTVNVAAADPFFLTLSARANANGAPRGLKLHDDGYAGPAFKLDRRGRRTRVR